jgi:hypothetical protein
MNQVSGTDETEISSASPRQQAGRRDFLQLPSERSSGGCCPLAGDPPLQPRLPRPVTTMMPSACARSGLEGTKRGKSAPQQPHCSFRGAVPARQCSPHRKVLRAGLTSNTWKATHGYSSHDIGDCTIAVKPMQSMSCPTAFSLRRLQIDIFIRPQVFCPQA